MKQSNTSRSTMLNRSLFVSILAVGLLTLVPAMSMASWQEQLRVNIPFGFVVDDTTLPEGEYVFYTSTSEPNALRIDRIDGEVGVLTLTEPLPEEASEGEMKNDFQIVFDELEGRRFLNEVHIQSGDWHWQVNKGKDYLDLKLDGKIGTAVNLTPEG